jgi:hypothetical protein
VAQYIDQLVRDSRQAANYWFVGALLIVSAYTADAFFRHRYDPRPSAIQQPDPLNDLSDRRLRDWGSVCDWIATSTPPGEVLLTPRNQQTFKWYAARGEVVNWKDVPQNAEGIVEWDQRMQDVFPKRVTARGLVSHGEPRLMQLGQKYGFRHLVLDRSRSARPLRFQRVYPPPGGRSLFEVYRLPEGEQPSELP